MTVGLKCDWWVLDVKTVTCEFGAETSSPLSSAQLMTYSARTVGASAASWGFVDECVVSKTSAYEVLSCLLREKFVMKILKKVTDMTDPWETPACTAYQVDFASLYLK